MYGFFSGTNLNGLLSDIQHFESLFPNKIVASFYASFQAVLNLLGENESNKNPAMLIGGRFDYKFCFDPKQKGYSVSRPSAICAIVAYLFGDYSSAYDFIGKCREYESTFLNMFVHPIYVFYEGLISLAIVKRNQNLTSPQTVQFVTKAKECLSQLKILSDDAPSNFLNKFHLLQAEMLIVLGDSIQANMHYQEAIRLSEKYGFPNEQALACERAGIFLLEQHRQTNSSFSANAATQLFLTSYKCYERWGAIVKMKDLKAKYLSNTNLDSSVAMLNTIIEVQNGSQDCISLITENSAITTSTLHDHATSIKIKKRKRLNI